MTFEIAPKSTETHSSWDEANLYCMFLEVGGKKGWRLPTKEELKVIYYTCQPYHYLPTNMFVNSYYWSAIEDSSDLAWFMDMSNGYAYSGFKGNHGYVRAVRDVS